MSSKKQKLRKYYPHRLILSYNKESINDYNYCFFEAVSTKNFIKPIYLIRLIGQTLCFFKTCFENNLFVFTLL